MKIKLKKSTKQFLMLFFIIAVVGFIWYSFTNKKTRKYRKNRCMRIYYTSPIQPDVVGGNDPHPAPPHLQ